MSKKKHRSRRSEDEGPIRHLIRARRFVQSIRVALGVTSFRSSLNSEPAKKSPVLDDRALEGAFSQVQSEANHQPEVEPEAERRHRKPKKKPENADYLELYEAVRVALGPLRYQPQSNELRSSPADEVVGRVHYRSVNVSEEKDIEKADVPYTGVYASLWESLRDALSTTGRTAQHRSNRQMVSLNGSINPTPQHASSSDSGSYRGAAAGDRIDSRGGAIISNSFADGLSVDDFSPKAPVNSADGSVLSSARLTPTRELDIIDLEIRLKASTWNQHSTGRNWLESTVAFQRGAAAYTSVGELAAPCDLSDGSSTPAVAGAWAVAPMTPMDITEAPTPNEDAIGVASPKSYMLTWNSLRDALANIQPSKNSSGRASNEDPVPTTAQPQSAKEDSREADSPANNKMFSARISISRRGSRSSLAHEIVAADLSSVDVNNSPRAGCVNYDAHDI